MRPNSILLLCALAIAAGIAVALQGGDPGGEGGTPRPVQPAGAPKEAEPSAPWLHGTLPPQATDSRPGKPVDPVVATLRGLVFDPLGHPVPGALVYLLPKAGDVKPRGHAILSVRADENGRWTFPDGVDASGHWVGVACDEFLPAHVDGDDARAGQELVFRLEEGGMVNVRLLGDHAAGASGTVVRVVGVPSLGSARLPGPGGAPEPRVVSHWAPGETQRLLRIGTRGAVRIEVERQGYFAVPGALTLPRPLGNADFTFHASGILHLRVMDATTGEHIPAGASFQLVDSHGRTAAAGYGRDPEGVLQTTTGIRPDTYELRVLADGYEPHQSPVEFSQPGQEVRREVRLARSSGDRTAVLTWAAGSDPLLLRTPLTLVRDITQTPSAWIQPQRVRLDGPGTLRVTVERPGHYDMILATKDRQHAAYVAPVRLRSVGEQAALVTWQRGLVLRLNLLDPAATGFSSLSLEGDIGVLPLFQVRPEVTSVLDPEDGVILGPDAVLGPYPCEDVVVRGMALRGAADPVGIQQRVERSE